MKKSFNVVLNSSDLSSYTSIGSIQRYVTKFDNDVLNKSYDVEVSFRSSQTVFDENNILVLNVNMTAPSNIIQNTNNSKMSCILDVVFTDRGTDKTVGICRTANHYNNTFRINKLTDIYQIEFGVKAFSPNRVSPDTGLVIAAESTVDKINGDWFDLYTNTGQGFGARYICMLKFTEV
jgi:hypothetical protein